MDGGAAHDPVLRVEQERDEILLLLPPKVVAKAVGVGGIVDALRLARPGGDGPASEFEHGEEPDGLERVEALRAEVGEGKVAQPADGVLAAQHLAGVRLVRRGVGGAAGESEREQIDGVGPREADRMDAFERTFRLGGHPQGLPRVL